MDEEQMDSRLYPEWKKEMSKKLTNVVIFKEDMPTVMKRCPKCHNLTLEFDHTTARLHCTRCGFEEHFKL